MRPQLRAFADIGAVASLAAEAEVSGWDGLFVWDHVVRHGGPEFGPFGEETDPRRM